MSVDQFIPKRGKSSYDLVFGAADTSKNFIVGTFNGTKVAAIRVKMPNFTNAPTGTLTIANAKGNIFDSSDAAFSFTISNNNYNNLFPLLNVLDLEGEYTVTLTLSVAPGGSGGTASVEFVTTTF